MAWQPQEDGLKQLAEYLRDSLGGFDRARQKQAEIVSDGPGRTPLRTPRSEYCSLTSFSEDAIAGSIFA